MKAIRLTCDALANPMGIDETRPVLQWVDERGITQSAYQVVCKKDDGSVLWDTGKVASTSMQIEWPGAPLSSRQHVFWRVRLWDEKDRPGPWSDSSHIETGLLNSSDWLASWISGDYPVGWARHSQYGTFAQMINSMHPSDQQPAPSEPRLKGRHPVDCFLRTFALMAQPVRARLYITACGLYEARLDGRKIGNFCMAPGYTDYRKRIYYQTFDVTNRLAPGTHELTVWLADGWFRGSTGAWGLINQFGTRTRFIAQLEMTFPDGSSRKIVTDRKWYWSNDGPIRFADNKDGEIVDARKAPTYSGRVRMAPWPVVPTASNTVPVTAHERFTPAPHRAPNGRLLFDLGQNIAGWVSLSFTGHAGQRLHLRCGEMLDRDGNLTLENIQCRGKNFATPLQQVDYTCREGLNHFLTRFCVFGFRYIEVDTDINLKKGDLTALAIYSDMPRTGRFVSSNILLNKFFEDTLWSTKGNSLDIPTDCPTRERHGWSGDAQIFFDTFSYLFDCRTFERKWLKDLCDAQRKDGAFTQVAPYGGVDSYMRFLDGSVGWADAGVLIPYRFWKHYTDSSVLREFYPAMRRYARFMIRRCGRRGLFSKHIPLPREMRKYIVNDGQCYGEWAEPTDVHAMSWKDTVAPHPEVATAYTALVMSDMEEIAHQLGENADETLYHRYAQGCRKAYQALRKLPAYSLNTDRQALLVRPLAFHLLDKKQAAFARRRLVEACNHYEWRVGTGFLSTPLILDVLASYDLPAAYRLLENTKLPGWLAMPRLGATTIWESWEGTSAQNGIGSLNHYSKGAVCAWLFRVMCGIQPAGERHFVLSPHPGGDLTGASASYDSIFGTVSSSWKRVGEQWEITIVVPPNTTADVRLPDGTSSSAATGTHVYRCTTR